MESTANHTQEKHPWLRQCVLGLAVSAVALACGSPTPPAADPSAPPPTESSADEDKYERIEGSAEEQCLDAARRVREPVPNEPIRIGLRHILVRHKESRRADKSITRRRGMACLRALEALEALEKGADWDATVKEYSDEKGAAERHGSLGTVTRDNLDESFADAAFALEVDQLSYVVESPAGYHIILRVE